MTCKFGILVTVLFLVCLIGKATSQGSCTGMTPCYCKFNNGQFLDISTLGKHTGPPRFLNVTDKAETLYSWNPCFNFTEGDCHEVAICAVKPTIPSNLVFALGYQSTASFTTDINNTVQITYTTKGDGVSPVRRAHVSLQCDRESPQNNNSLFRAIGQNGPDSTDYFFELTSPLACPQGTPYKPSTPHKAMSTTSIVLICVGVVIALVLVAMTLTVLKKKGKICVKVEYEDL